ncbi:uncharacterized protein LOC101862229 [Aplysia californica]|uniref:Uncharacterized protein LOC101862229 n=1 Tax=Aplysia californica TaxID=6500 RepID=A0ABM0K8S0_APLCA|nr:uncharacterized protein LOC101862229 [Aplysia californica]
MDYHLQLELWRGNVAGAVQIARQRNELSDWIVAMAPQASLELWQEVSGEYAEQLEEDGQYHKAATYLLAAQKVRQTIDLFRRHRLFKEAVSLAKVRLSPMDPVLEDLYMEWGQVLMKDGQIEQAAKCYLAMRQVQEAGMVLTRRQDHASLKTACHMTLIANEQHPQGMLYAFRLFSQYLASGDWSEAHAFIAEHETLKVLLPLLCTHELLVQQLASLCPELTLTQKSSTSDHFFLKEKKEPATGKVGPPEFLLDKSERDPVVPWEAHLIGEHSFPHHVLRAWYRGLDIARLLQELNATYMAIVQMAPPQQGAPDTPTVLVQVSVELTLCLLSLLTAETTSAVLHLLHSLAALHQGGHLKLLQAICRLMLPQGPKYMLKLQQEFNASRVLIAMENNGNVDQAGVEGHNTIKKYLTDVKEDGHISTASPRCRELDCVRAYFYLVVLDYLREDLNLSHSDNDSLDGMPNGPLSGEASSGGSEGGAVSDIGKESGSLTSSEGGATKEKSVLSSSPKSGDSSPGAGGEVKDDVKSAPCAASPGVAGKKSDSSSSTRPKLKCDSQEGVATSGEKVGEKTTSSSLSKSGSKDKEDSDRSHQLGSLSSPTAPKSSSVDPPSVLLPPLATKAVKGSSRSPPSPLSSSPLSPHAAPKASSTSALSSSPTSAAAAAAMPPRSPGSLHGGDPLSVIKGNSPVSENSSKLSATAASSSPSSLSPPLLSLSPNTSSTGTASATSPSVTTRGQISFRNLLRLSKGILWDVQAKREALTETLGYIHRAISQHLLTNRTSVSSEEGPESESSGSSSRKDGGAHGEEDGGSHRPQLSSVPAAATSPVLSGTPDILKGAHVGATGQPGSVTPPSTTTPTSLSPRLEFGGYRGPIRSLSEPMAHSNTPTSPLEGKMESNVIGFQVEKELLGSFTDYLSSSQKSRKILWMDNRGSPEDIDSGPLSPSGSMARDAGGVPVDWDELPVDVKYFQPYVSLTMLKQEQEALSQELKRVPDTSKAPFPSSRASIKKLMEVCLHSPLLSPQERAVYHKQLSDWAVLFSVTSQQKLETDEFFSAVVAKLGSSS